MNPDFTDKARLASFPEQNPNPVIEISPEGNILYLNSAAETSFPGILAENIAHPVFNALKNRIRGAKNFTCEVTVEDKIYEQKIFFDNKNRYIRIYCSDITDRIQIEKNLSRLASFPEQNPTPIVEIDLGGNITYFNPAFLLHFPEFYSLKTNHPALQPVLKYLERFRSGELKEYTEELMTGNKYYSQRARILDENKLIRIFNVDITIQKRNEEIIQQKNKDITDSINYARKIQHAILPPEEILKAHFSEAFVFYLPKDIISGDFYWFTQVESISILACADCTGHGVPGALMSMIGVNLISQIVNDKNITSPGKALTELDLQIRKSLNQDKLENESRDGMDISLCAFNPESCMLQYAGANRPLCFIKNGELSEIKPGKFPIGGQHAGEKLFPDTELKLNKSDTFYLFTDGYTDQFGGPSGKKFMKKNLYKLLQQIHSFSMDEQKEKLRSVFEEWKNGHDQVDDVCLVGVRI